MTKPPSRVAAILLAILVTFLWSTSWILIKIGLKSDLPPVTFAGLRYSLAFLCLAPFAAANPAHRLEVLRLGKKGWARLALYGVLLITITQTAQYAALEHLPAAMTSLILNLSSMFVAIAGIRLLHEAPSPVQWGGVLLTVLGVGLYFLPVAIQSSQWVGLLFALICLAGNVPASLMGRQLNRSGELSPLIITFIGLGIGSTLMLGIGFVTEGMGNMTRRDWMIVLWLAVVNTALAFTIWNFTLRTLTAMESSIINNLMMPQIALLAYLFLGETLSMKEVLGLVLVGIGVLIVQLARPRETATESLAREQTS